MAAELKISLVDESGGGPTPPPAPPWAGYFPSGSGPGGPPIPPRAGYGGKSEVGDSTVTAFDRPQAVVIMGPRPLDVRVVDGPKGKGGSAAAKEKKPKETWAEWVFKRASNATAAIGTAASATAGNKAVPALVEGIGAAASGLARMGPYGRAAAAALGAVTVAVTAFKATVDAFVARGRELSGYNGNLAATSAMADVRKMGSDLREADVLGDKFAKLIEAQSKSEAIWSEILLQIKGPILEVLTTSLKTANEALVGILEATSESSSVLAGAFLGLAATDLRDLVIRLKKILAGDAMGDADKLVRMWLDAPKGLVPPPALPAPAPGPIGFPIFP